MPIGASRSRVLSRVEGDWDLIRKMVIKVDERVQVGAVFGEEKKIQPRWFIWNGRQYRIREVTYTWSERQGRASLHYFSATDGANLFELCYNSESMVWSLTQVDDGSY